MCFSIQVEPISIAPLGPACTKISVVLHAMELPTQRVLFSDTDNCIYLHTHLTFGKISKCVSKNLRSLDL